MPEIPTLLVATSRTTKYEVQPHDGVATLGRDQSATIHIPDSRISRRHLLLEPRADGWHAVDTSSNGTYLDGEPIEDILITGTTRVNLGDPEGIPVHIDLAQDSSAPRPSARTPLMLPAPPSCSTRTTTCTTTPMRPIQSSLVLDPKSLPAARSSA